jgi:hypothetical protein
MRNLWGLVVIAAGIAVPATADATAKFYGWTAEGQAVIADDRAAWEGLAVCTPAAFDAKGEPVAEACTACGATAAACGVTHTPVKAMKSPDKRLTLTTKERCYITGHDADIRRCSQRVVVKRLGAVEHDDELTGGGGKARMAAYFRPDGGAVVITFTGGAADDDIWTIDLGELAARERIPATVIDLLARQAKAIAEPIYTPEAVLFTDDAKLGALTPAELAKVIGSGVTLGPLEIEASFDGHAAWASFVATTADNRAYRVTELFVRGDKNSWWIESGYWSQGRADAEANAKAAAGLPGPAEVARLRQDLPDSLSVLGAMLRDGDPELAKRFSRRPRAMIVGTAPAERFLGGPKLAAAWKGWFAAGVRGVRVRGALSPRASTGWIITNVDVTKHAGATTYRLPVRVWMVVDHNDKGAFEVVASHAAVAL